jgi:hypothetical protein
MLLPVNYVALAIAGADGRASPRVARRLRHSRH